MASRPILTRYHATPADPYPSLVGRATTLTRAIVAATGKLMDPARGLAKAEICDLSGRVAVRLIRTPTSLSIRKVR